MLYSRDKVGHFELSSKGQRMLSDDLLEEKKLNKEFDQLSKEFEAWERKNERNFLNESLPRQKVKKLERERKDFKKRFNLIKKKYLALLRKNKKEIGKEVKRHG